MTDKEKIRKEVQRLMDELIQEQKNGYGYDADYACILELRNILTYIDSLQEEPVSIDFEQELYKAFGQVKDFTLGMRIAKWFYDMGKNSQEPVSEDLKEEINRYIEPLSPEDIKATPFCSIEDCARHFAKWQKEQMMKDAVEASVNTYEEIGGEGYVEFVANVPIGKYKEKDVVKIITI